ncbi:amino acid adenylation domain-containing protein [Streptomyces sp. yr375]|uniref:non-ribosomal peptide synthetase n=1 Tax=Streptomyces sp. yr375 TaxID=1761906 RepID=UPI0008CB9088|nr:amino acid adenylation domain-containing protein [Streptomyces sp. yr375]SES04825.1 amino acid adenylation domain-containing protein [Streptomyces sp. yr375]
MSSHLDLLKEMEQRGLAITLEGGDLRLQGVRERMDPEFVARIRAAKEGLVAHLADQARRTRGFPLTPLQRGYLLGRDGLFEIGDVASHVYHEVEGVWDLDRLEAALTHVVDRHSALRSRFPADDRQTEQPPGAALRIARLDLRGESAERRREIRSALRAERSHRVLPADGPLIAVEATVLADDLTVLHISHDGLVMDGISMFLFFRAWWQAYEQGPDVDADGPEELRFSDHVAALEQAAARAPARRSRAYWLDRLDDLAPHPDLPLRVSPASITGARFVPREVRLDARRWTVLRGRAAEAGLTPSALLLAAYAETLATWGAGSAFTLNTTVANRPPVHPRAFDAIGQFSDTMLVEVAVDRRMPFVERARAVQTRLRTDLDHRHFSGLDALRELSRRRGGPAGARMPFTFNSALGHGQDGVDGSALELFGPETYTVSQTPQVWLNVFAMERRGGLVVQFDSVDELFPEGLPAALVHGYRTLLETLTEEHAWQATDFDLLPEAQRARRRAANDTAVALPDTLLGEAFVARARQSPDAPAVITSDATVTYGELLARASHAAHWLRERGLARDELVGLVATRGPDQITGILATVLAGGAYLPVDAALPAARREYMLRDGRVRLVLTNTGYEDTDREVLDLTGSAAAPAATSPAPPAPLPGACPDDLAYVLYTSGTTGEPKGVMVSHRSVANVVADCAERFGIGPADRFFAVSAFNFDLSVWDVFGALSAGAALVMPDAGRAADPAHWLELCASAGVTVWNSVPAIVSLMHDQALADSAVPPALRLVMMSGDRIPPTLPAALRRTMPELSVVSLGGPTETTIWNILHPVGPDEDGSESIPYGRPNANNRAYVLDRDGLDAPDWVTGEICAAGAGLARGYWGDEQRTAERFRHDARRGERLYRTGDLGRYLPDGSIQILGRGDFQIKVNGYRIEAGEVETRLVALDAVRQAVVAARPGARGDRLVAHLVPAGEDRPALAELREALRRDLPDYMIPSVLVWHPELPLTRNGKVDRKALAATAVDPAAEGNPVAEGGGAAFADETEKTLAGIWTKVLRTEAGPTDSLYDLGGDSLAAARIITAVRKEFRISIPLERMADLETLRAMAAHITLTKKGADA